MGPFFFISQHYSSFTERRGVDQKGAPHQQCTMYMGRILKESMDAKSAILDSKSRLFSCESTFSVSILSINTVLGLSTLYLLLLPSPF